MKRHTLHIALLLLLFCGSASAQSFSDDEFMTEDYSGMMNGWTIHSAYNDVSELAYAAHRMYALADGALFSVSTEADEELRLHNTLSGLSGSNIGHIIGAPYNRLLIAYGDGMFDIISPDGSISTITDLARKQLSGVSKLASDIACEGNNAYLACDFGLLVLNLSRKEISEWYQPTQAANPMLRRVHLAGDSIYAASETVLYAGCLRDNLVDFAAWQAFPLESRTDIVFPWHFSRFLNADDADYMASYSEGLVREKNGHRTAFLPNGPAVNYPYRMTFSADRMIMVPGGRWTSENARFATVMIYKDGEWSNIPYDRIHANSPHRYDFDFTRAAIDPADPEHFFCSSYGEGLYEFRGQDMVKNYNLGNSPYVSASGTSTNYVRVDGIAFDREGNLWTANASAAKTVHVLSPHGQWASISAAGQVIHTPGDIIIDNQRPNYKWVISCRIPAGVALIDDRGTPLDPSDDRTVFRSTFVDGKGKVITPNEIHSAVQDRNGALWVGTKEGLFMIPSSVDFFTSNRCSRIIIVRTDGSDLGDYMLGTEQINAIAVDGGNRLWIGTVTSGAYLMDIDLFGYETKTVKHFTAKNTPLPTDHILSIGIDEASGEVFFGTTGGLVSYKGDASAPADDFEEAYVYPNPVRPDYQGLLTITGLMEDAPIRITDASGNLVCSTEANGGTAVWDMRDDQGRRVRPGVYLIFCNSGAGAEPSGHKMLKVLIM